ncbi:ribosome recycling factor [Candidatus Dojkabacteria bacterium]|nr:ribosome recycling factor [Candidatus Dojkabacteria bacterium]
MEQKIFSELDKKFNGVRVKLKEGLNKLRSGRATPDMLSDIQVEAYSQKMPIEQLANINVVDATLLTVQPWDKSTIQPIENAIKKSDIGINPIVDGDIIRLPLPPLTQERREEYVKLLKDKIEEARIDVRQIRQEINEKLESFMEDAGISEDVYQRLKKQVQEKVDAINEEIEKISEEKEKDLLEV